MLLSVTAFAKKITRLCPANYVCSVKVLFLSLVGSAFLSIANATILVELVGTAEPVVKLEGKHPVACGVLISGDYPWNGKFSLTIALVRHPPTTVLRVSLLQFDGEPSGIEMAEPFAKTINFKKGANAFTWDAFPTSEEGAQVMQALMVGGLKFYVFDRHGRIFGFGGPRPMPQNVRATYLNCAGDMYRQE